MASSTAPSIAAPTGIRTVHVRDAAFLLVLSVLPILFLLPLFGAPFERDQGTYATIARGWMDGAVPYRDLWDNKGPLLFLWYAASFSWLGETIVAPRVLAGIAAGLCVPFVWATADRLFDRRVATTAAVVFALSFANVYLQVTANAEVFMLLPMTVGLWAFAVGATGGRQGWFLVAGALTALAVFTRQSAVWMFVGYAAWLAIVSWREPADRPRHMASMAAMAAGALLGAAPFVIYFASQGALLELWHAMFGFNLGWAAEQSTWLKFVPPLFVEPAPLFGGLLLWVLALIGIWRLWKRSDRAAWLVLSVLVVSEAAVQTMGKGSAHYSIQLLPAVAISVAVGLPYVARRWRARDMAFRSVLAASALVTLCAAAFAYAPPTPEERFVAQYTFRDYADDAVQAPAIAAAVARMTEAEDCVYEWGRSSQIYFLADRAPCTRWIHDRPYEVDTTMLGEVMADLEERTPAVILVTTDEPPPRELQAFIEEHYRFTEQVAYASLHERVGG